MAGLLEHAGEHLVGLSPGDQQPLIDHPRRYAVDAEPDRDARLALDPVEVALIAKHVDDLGGIESDRGAFLDQYLLVADVTSTSPVGVEQSRVQLVKQTALAGEL